MSYAGNSGGPVFAFSTTLKTWMYAGTFVAGPADPGHYFAGARAVNAATWKMVDQAIETVRGYEPRVTVYTLSDARRWTKIAPNDQTPSMLEKSVFAASGPTKVREFFIWNGGRSTLRMKWAVSVNPLGAKNCFSVKQAPSLTAEPSSFTSQSLKIEYYPLVKGWCFSDVVVRTNDSTRPEYHFKIGGFSN